MPADTLNFIGFKADPQLIKAIDKARGTDTRSQFLRDAAVAAIKVGGVKLSDKIASPPDRQGKGGPKPKEKKP